MKLTIDLTKWSWRIILFPILIFYYGGKLVKKAGFVVASTIKAILQ